MCDYLKNCINCFKKDATSATIVDICGECGGKRGREPLLATIAQKMYGLCFFCGKHKFNVEQINARFCRRCHRKIADVTKAYNKAGGTLTESGEQLGSSMMRNRRLLEVLMDSALKVEIDEEMVC